MGAATRLLVGAALAVTPLTPAAATPAAATPAAAEAGHRSPTCHYVNQTKDTAPIRLGPGKKHRKAADLPPSGTPIKATCAARGRGPEHWVRIKAGDQKGHWIWRDRLQAWTGE
uniref:SH3b domain-containing protein n=1 Tax=Nonomuraea gerenzanensis TaxID=93944 RepID=A0A1M4EIU2_9ACTN|nr:hypothetical protein [Nonomuraea gerenzanensis]SBO98740.1 hypothetical protein BN4615_P8256 [Nonomuraea gerenzanensis]